ncbi:MAG: DUF5606 domain-containing protein [Mucinivorans sp.]
MNLKEILSIAGQSGLYKYVAQGKGGIIVQALTAEAQRQMVSGSAKVSSLGDIAIFTENQEVPLADILEVIFKNMNGAALAISNKSTAEELHSFMEQSLPSYDKSRVHDSDIKKLATWYNILVSVGVTTFKDEEQPLEAAAAASSATASAAADKPKTRRVATAATASRAKANVSTKPKATATKGTTARKSS